MSTRRPQRRAVRERGSALILFPAAVLVVVALGVICVDSGATLLARRALIDHVTATADEVAAQAIDVPAFYATPPVVRIDRARAVQVAADVEAFQRRDGAVTITAERVDVSPDGRQVTVTASGLARTVFAFGPARRRSVSLRASATATVHEVTVRGP